MKKRLLMKDLKIKLGNKNQKIQNLTNQLSTNPQMKIIKKKNPNQNQKVNPKIPKNLKMKKKDRKRVKIKLSRMKTPKIKKITLLNFTRDKLSSLINKLEEIYQEMKFWRI